jgi:hypothetical protein
MTTPLVAALYARTSHEKDDAFSLSSQLTELRDAARTEGFIVPQEYVFQEECTGKIADRPELNKVRKLMREGAINILAVFDASHLPERSVLQISYLMKYLSVVCNSISFPGEVWSRIVSATARFSMMRVSMLISSGAKSKNERCVEREIS